MNSAPYKDRYIGTISKHEMVVDRYDYEYGDQKARAWDALCSFLKKSESERQVRDELLIKMDELLKEEKNRDGGEENDD